MEWLRPGWCPRVVAFDIDGTLTDENKRLDMHAVEALRRLEDAVFPLFLRRVMYVRSPMGCGDSSA